MNADIRPLILNNKDAIEPSDLVDVRVKHPKFGLGRITKYCSDCKRVEVRFDDDATVEHEDLHDLLVKPSIWKVSIKQLERRFAHFHKQTQAAPKRSGLFSGHVASAQSKPRATANSKTTVKRPVRKLAFRVTPPGLKPLFRMSTS